MTSVVGYVFVLVGASFSLGGFVRLISVFGDGQLALVWGTVWLVGTIVIGLGVSAVRTSDATGSTPRPENALGKSDPRFGSR